MTTIYFAGGEDIDFSQTGGSTVITTASHFRSAFSRCALRVPSSVLDTFYWQNYTPFSTSSFWLSAQVFGGGITTNTALNLLKLLDSSNIVRFRIAGTGANSTFAIFKVNAAGTSTQLGSNFTLTFSTTILDKLDINIVDSASGSVAIYLNGISIFTFSGDTTTDGVSTIANIRLQQYGSNTDWSEIIISDADTRTMSLQTLAPVANGNTHNFDTGSPAAANVNEVTLNDATLDGSTTAGQIDQYTIPAIASGTYTIMAIGVSARMRKGTSGPSKADLNVRSGGSDFFSSDQVLTTAFADYINWWTTDPNTSATWTAYPSNIGIKSVT